MKIHNEMQYGKHLNVTWKYKSKGNKHLLNMIFLVLTSTKLRATNSKHWHEDQTVSKIIPHKISENLIDETNFNVKISQ